MRFETRTRRTSDVWRWLAGQGAVLLIGAGAVWFQRFGHPVCLFRRLTGLPCLTCGTTRALSALATGNLVDAVRLQPLMSGAVLAALVWGVLHTALLFAWRRVPRLRFDRSERRWFGAGLCALAALNWIYLLWCG